MSNPTTSGDGVPRVFFLSSHTCHLRAIDASTAIEVPVAVGRVDELGTPSGALAGSLVHDLADAYGGVLPPSLSAQPGVSEGLLLAMRPFEEHAKLMMDRNNWARATPAEIHRLYVRYIAIWDHLLHEHAPDAVVFNDAPHRGFDHVLYGLCKVREIPWAYFSMTMLDRRVMLHPAVDRPSDPLPIGAWMGEDDARRSQTDAPPGWYAADIPRQRDASAAKQTLSWSFRPGQLKRLRRLPDLFRRRPRGLLALRDTTRLRQLLHRARVRREMRLSLRLYEQIATGPPPAPYAYLALHLQPEATTVPLGGALHEPLNVVRLAAGALPDGWRLVVKEHPQMARYREQWARARNREFYRELASIPRVSIAPLDHSQEELIGDARVVITSTGTVGWEAIHIGTPVVATGFPWYRGLPGVVRATDEEGFRDVYERVLAGWQVDRQELAKAVDDLRKRHTVEAIWHRNDLPTAPDPEPLLERYAAAVREFAERARRRPVGVGDDRHA